MEATARKTLIEYTRIMYDKGFFPGIDGNVSIRVDENAALLTPGGMCKRLLTKADLVLMSLDGEVLAGDRNPTSEAGMHLSAYKHRSEVGAVIHAHSPNVTAYSMSRKPLDSRYTPFSYFHLGDIGHVPYMTGGTKAFHSAVTDQIKAGYKAIVFDSHGSLMLGEDMTDAFVKMDMLEAYAGMLIKAAALGGAQSLTDQELSKLKHG